MPNNDNEGLGLDDSDHLPWLETADDYEYDNSPSIFKIILWFLMALMVIAFVAAAYYWYQNRSDDSANQGDGALITAQEGDYKVAPEDRQGKQFEGEGDVSFAASEGQKVSSVIGKEDKSDDIKTDSLDTKGTDTKGKAVIQLGAFSDIGSATSAWNNLSRRFGFLSDDQRKIVEGSVDGGRTIYRLQAIANNNSEASDICIKLKAAGENCLVVR